MEQDNQMNTNKTEKDAITFDYIDFSNARMAFKTENGIVWATRRQMERAKQLTPEQFVANRKRIEHILRKGLLGEE